jgi:hypothetical protein
VQILAVTEFPSSTAHFQWYNYSLKKLMRKGIDIIAW